MEASAKSALTLVVLVLLLLLGAVWGWASVSEPLPDGAVGGEQVAAPKCVEKSVDQGTRVYPDEVTVSVFNGGTESGLAGTTMGLLGDRGFATGDTGNAPGDQRILRAQIWTDDRNDPAVRLVASHLGPVRIVEGKKLGVGVVVVVGDDLDRLAKGRKFTVAGGPAQFCSPSAD